MATVSYSKRLRDGRVWMAETFVPDALSSAPVAIVLPGEASDRTTEAFRDLGTSLAERGVAAVLADHWPAPGPVMFREGGDGFREAVENVVCLVRSAGRLTGIEADGVVIYGQSAGGVDGLFVTLAGEDVTVQWDGYAEEHDGPGPQIECAGDGPFDLRGFVGYAGGYAAPTLMRSMNEAMADFLDPNVRRDGPPRVLRLIDGERDSTIPPPAVALHAEMAEALAGAGHDVTRESVDDVHIPTTGSAGWQASLDAITELALGQRG